MPEFKETETSKPNKLLKTLVDNGQFRTALISKNNKIIVDTIKNETDGYSSAETSELVSGIFSVIADRDNRNNPDKLDAAVQILNTLDFDKVDPEKTVESYSKALLEVTPLSDPYGQITAFLEAGKLIAPHLSYEQGKTLKVSWTKVKSMFDRHTDYPYIEQSVRSIMELVPKPSEEKKPKFSKEIDPLNNYYIDEVNKNNSFKLRLWSCTPEFRQTALSCGIDIAKFWNLNDPKETLEKLDKILSVNNSVLNQALERNVQKLVGQPLSSLNSEERMVVADELLEALRSAHKEIAQTTPKFEDVVDRFKNLLGKKESLGTKGKNTIKNDFKKFLAENGAVEIKNDFDSLAKILEDKEALDFLRQNYELKQKNKKEAALAISENIDLVKPQYVLISRSKDDLYLGDQTGDCTAYKGDGSNSWTVPNWLANPGFNFLKINGEDGKLLAKAGLLLATADDKPVLVIDSLEAVPQIKAENEDEAKKIITDGLRLIDEWSKRIGCKDTFIVTFTNSKGLTNMAMSLSEPGTNQKKQAIGGSSGLTELREKAGLPRGVGEIHLQSEGEDIDIGDMQEMESFVRNFLRDLRPDIKIQVENAMKSYDWKRLSSMYLDEEFPMLSKYIGSNLADYEKYFTREPTFNLMSKNIKEDMTELFNVKIRQIEIDNDHVNEEYIEGEDDGTVEKDEEYWSQFERGRVHDEIVELLDDREFLYDELEDTNLVFVLGLDPNDANKILKKLYGFADPDLNLDPELRKLKIQ